MGVMKTLAFPFMGTMSLLNVADQLIHQEVARYVTHFYVNDYGV